LCRARSAPAATLNQAAPPEAHSKTHASRCSQSALGNGHKIRLHRRDKAVLFPVVPDRCHGQGSHQLPFRLKALNCDIGDIMEIVDGPDEQRDYR
jgi:hypothetical protein